MRSGKQALVHYCSCHMHVCTYMYMYMYVHACTCTCMLTYVYITDSNCPGISVTVPDFLPLCRVLEGLTSVLQFVLEVGCAVVLCHCFLITTGDRTEAYYVCVELLATVSCQYLATSYTVSDYEQRVQSFQKAWFKGVVGAEFKMLVGVVVIGSWELCWKVWSL